jgi:hypothetical protein
MILSKCLPPRLAKALLPALFFFAGVAYDVLTLTRIDRWADNLILLGYLVLLGALIILNARAEEDERRSHSVFYDIGRDAASPSGTHTPHKTWRRYAPIAVQFRLGGLFSAYTIFYSRSASLTGTAIFFGVLVTLLVGNEFLHDRLSSVRLMLGLYALVSCAFFTFFLPVVTGIMNTGMFLAGVLLSAVLIVGMVRMICPVSKRNFHGSDMMRTALPAFLVLAIIMGSYFLNWIPPVPLSLKFGGMYHHITKVGDSYQLTMEKRPWYRVWQRSDGVFRDPDPAYCFTAVFAPVDLQTQIFHHWQYRPLSGIAGFATTDRIRLPIRGGREEGYRSYTAKRRLTPGKWRVDVETADGRIIGRIAFLVEEGESAGAFETRFY